MMCILSACSKETELIKTDYVSMPQYESLDVEPMDLDDEKIKTDVEDELAELVQQHTTYTDVEGRSIETGDSVVVDVILNPSVSSDYPFSGGPLNDYRVQVGDKHAPIFTESLIGHSIGDVYQWEGTLPDNYEPEELAGIKVRFDITIKAVQIAKIPKVDDAFAAKVSDTATTVKELKHELTEQMADIYKKDISEINNVRTWISMIDQANITTYPQDRFDDVKSRMITTVKTEADANNQSYEEYIQTQYDLSVTEYEANLDIDVKSYLKEVLVAEAILEQEKHTITDAEYSAAKDTLVQQYSYESEQDLTANLTETQIQELITIEVAKNLLVDRI